MATVAEQFAALGEWVTRFEIDGRFYGGSYVAEGDDRLAKFVSRMATLCPNPSRILECGCLEGGHTLALAERFPQARIRAVDVRGENLAKASMMADLRGAANIDFIRDDFDAPREVFPGSYDAVFCVGLLYHLRWPDRFLKRACEAAPILWLWTVYCAEDAVSATEGLYRGRFYDEPMNHPLSAVREQSLFPTLGSLCDMLWAAGYMGVELVRKEMTANGSGPAILLCATRPA